MKSLKQIPATIKYQQKVFKSLFISGVIIFVPFNEINVMPFSSQMAEYLSMILIIFHIQHSLIISISFQNVIFLYLRQHNQ